MSRQNSLYWCLVFTAVAGGMIAGCHMQKGVVTNASDEIPAIHKIASVTAIENGVFRAEALAWLPTEKAHRGEKTFVVRFTNLRHSSNPLRYSASNLVEYQVKLGHLLKDGKSDLYLKYGAKTYYPVSYSFTPQYGAFPLDEVVVGFAGLPKSANAPSSLYYLDQIFFGDTLCFQF